MMYRDLEAIDRVAREIQLGPPAWRKVAAFWYRVKDGMLSEVFDPFHNEGHKTLVEECRKDIAAGR